uniref:Uncharacterized protein n=1 Tax=Setaria viridis TaxID=4556 RepID=A0A4U6W653_SETVI|nr:hypothetical protein SEVIR_1G012900v2 [Setaria viridis]
MPLSIASAEISIHRTTTCQSNSCKTFRRIYRQIKTFRQINLRCTYILRCLVALQQTPQPEEIVAASNRLTVARAESRPVSAAAQTQTPERCATAAESSSSRASSTSRG